METHKFASLSHEEKRRILFYADTEAGLYDVSIHKVVPQYDLAHLTLIKLLQSHFKDFDSAPVTILDIGAGSGQETLSILQNFPQVRLVALDLCQPILDILIRKISTNEDLSKRCSIVCADVLSDSYSEDKLRRLLPSDEDERGFAAVVSAFALHHLSHLEKREIFRRVFKALLPGGLFLNLDLFSFQSNTLASQALDFDLMWIEENLSESTDESLRDKWIEHYKTANLTEPFENPPSKGNELPGQERMLLDAGFNEVACPYRYWQVGISWALKV